MVHKLQGNETLLEMKQCEKTVSKSLCHGAPFVCHGWRHLVQKARRVVRIFQQQKRFRIDATTA